MKLISTSKLLLLALTSTMVFSCSVSDDDQLPSNKSVQPEIEHMSKSTDSTYVENEPLIPKPRG